jgi:hypothetical protein
MAGKVQAVKGKAVLADFLELGANAFAGGLMVAIALAVITLALASSAQAAPLEPAAIHDVACASSSAAEEPRSVAPTPADEDAVGVGALWANLMLGTVALSSAGIVAFLGRSVPARRIEKGMVGVRGFEPPASTSRT